MPFVTGTESDSDGATCEPTSAWLKSPEDPTLNQAINLREFAPLARPRKVTVHQALGRADLIGVTSGIGLYRGRITVLTETLAERQAVRAVLDADDTMLLQIPSERTGDAGEQWYIEEDEATTTETRLMQGMWDPDRDVSFGWYEVDVSHV